MPAGANGDVGARQNQGRGLVESNDRAPSRTINPQKLIGRFDRLRVDGFILETCTETIKTHLPHVRSCRRRTVNPRQAGRTPLRAHRATRAHFLGQRLHGPSPNKRRYTQHVVGNRTHFPGQEVKGTTRASSAIEERFRGGYLNPWGTPISA